MSYIKQTWIDRLTEFYRRFSAVEDASGNVQLTDEPGIITDEGSPISAARLNHMEDGIEGAHNDIGSRTYTENNYVTDNESVTDSIDALDMGIASHLAESASKHITESGVNAYGRYIKFDDGTMECYGRNELEFNAAPILSRLITFPKAFVGDQPSVSLSFIHGERNFTAATAWDGWTLGIQTLTTSAMEVRLWSTLSSFQAGNTQPITWRAIGRWKA